MKDDIEIKSFVVPGAIVPKKKGGMDNVYMLHTKETYDLEPGEHVEMETGLFVDFKRYGCCLWVYGNCKPLNRAGVHLYYDIYANEFYGQIGVRCINNGDEVAYVPCGLYVADVTVFDERRHKIFDFKFV